jgi:N-acetylneuraminic acid mutarotase
MRVILFLIITLSFSNISWAQSNYQWNKESEYPTFKGRFGGVAFSIGNNGFIGTGSDSTTTINQSFWKYNTVNHSWNQIDSLPGLPRFYGVGFAINGKGYVGTGGNGYTNFLNDFWEFDTVTNQWSQKSNFPGIERYGASGFSINGKGYVGLGIKLPGQFFNDLWEYNPTTDVWIQKASLPAIKRLGSMSFVIGNNAYIIGGQDSTYSYTNEVWEYNSTNDTWIQKSNFPGPPRAYGTGFSINNKGYICSGFNMASGDMNDFWEYDQNNDQWIQITSFCGDLRRETMGFEVGNSIFFGFGRKSNFHYHNDLWSYTPYNLITDSVNICNGDSVLINGISQDSEGLYSSNTNNYSGCDSVSNVYVQVIYIDTSLTFNNHTMTSNTNNGSYQWLYCDSAYAPIIGETNQSYTATANGNYAVQVSINGCVDTTSCFSIINVGVMENDFGNKFLPFPNPSDGKFIIVLDQLFDDTKLEVLNSLGQQIWKQENITDLTISVTLKEAIPGIYFIKISSVEEINIQKIVVK